MNTKTVEPVVGAMVKAAGDHIADCAVAFPDPGSLRNMSGMCVHAKSRKGRRDGGEGITVGPCTMSLQDRVSSHICCQSFPSFQSSSFKWPPFCLIYRTIFTSYFLTLELELWSLSCVQLPVTIRCPESRALTLCQRVICVHGPQAYLLRHRKTFKCPLSSQASDYCHHGHKEVVHDEG